MWKIIFWEYAPAKFLFRVKRGRRPNGARNWVCKKKKWTQKKGTMTSPSTTTNSVPVQTVNFLVEVFACPSFNLQKLFLKKKKLKKLFIFFFEFFMFVQNLLSIFFFLFCCNSSSSNKIERRFARKFAKNTSSQLQKHIQCKVIEVWLFCISFWIASVLFIKWFKYRDGAPISGGDIFVERNILVQKKKFTV